MLGKENKYLALKKTNRILCFFLRHQSNRNELQYISTCSDPQQSLRMSHIEQDLDDLDDSGNHYSAHTNSMLIIDEGGASANISPYKMNPNYKRPNNPSQNSDHGYRYFKLNDTR